MVGRAGERRAAEPALIEAPAAGSGKGWRWARVGLVLVGVGISGYLTWARFAGVEALCTGVGGCEIVQNSLYSQVAGVPVALIGLIGYLALLPLTLWAALAGDGAPWGLPLGMLGIALVGVLYSAYLTYVEVFVIEAICPWCVASAIVMLGVLALSVWDLRQVE